MLCWWPYAIILMVERENKRLLDDMILLPYLNSLINPCLYMIINRDVRTALKNFFRCNQQSDEVADAEELSSSTTNFTLKRMKKVFAQEQV